MVSVRPMVITPRREATTGAASFPSRARSPLMEWVDGAARDAATAASPLIVPHLFVRPRNLDEKPRGGKPSGRLQRAGTSLQQHLEMAAQGRDHAVEVGDVAVGAGL